MSKKTSAEPTAVTEQLVSTWQRLAIETNNILTVANCLSIAGLVLVLWGAIELSDGRWILGLVAIGLGRLLDLADGFVARRTQTASRLGELVDTGCDKLGILALLFVGYRLEILSAPLMAALLVYNVFAAAYGLLWGRQYRLRVSRFGKVAMFTAWLAIGAALLAQKMATPTWWRLSDILTAAYIGLAAGAMYTYCVQLWRVWSGRAAPAPWVGQVNRVVYVYNPKASNAERSRQLLAQLSEDLPSARREVDIHSGWPAIRRALGDLAKLKPNQTVLILVAGGDGTVHNLVNLLEAKLPLFSLSRIYILPLWGGNANDLACMLNGTNPDSVGRSLLARADVVTVPLVRLQLGRKQMLACCYASFGASALAARSLDKDRNHPIRRLPLLSYIDEFFSVVKALVNAPEHQAEVEAEPRLLYEHTIINGPRMAKISQVPVELVEPRFFHALVDSKGPSILVTIIRIILRRDDNHYSKRNHLTFKAKNRLAAQVDGELLDVPAGTQVTAEVYHTKLRFISIRYAR